MAWTVKRLLLAAVLVALAQGPSLAGEALRKVRMVVPFPPGGATDVIARIVQPKFQQALGADIVIENRGGAGGSLGTQAVARAVPDGSTVLFTFSSHTINPALYPNLGYDVEKDFAPVGAVATLPQILVAHPRVAFDSVAGLLSAARAEPDGLSYGSAGSGSAGHLAGELMKQLTGVQITHVPYRGGGPAVGDVVAGHVPLLWVSIAAVVPYVKQGLLKPLAVSTARRSMALPDVPTMAEAGVPGFEVDSWCGVFVPVGTPAATVARLNQALNSALGDERVKALLTVEGAEPAGGTPRELGDRVAVELPKWQTLVRQLQIKAD